MESETVTKTPTISPTVTIELDRMRAIRVDFNALCLLEERGGRSIMNADSWRKLKMKDLRFMLWVGLRHEDPTLTEKDIGRYLHMGNLAYVMQRVSQAWTASINGPEGKSRPLEIRANDRTAPVPMAV